jgi:glycosyltransferase involved in cell wall biosynthesis
MNPPKLSIGLPVYNGETFLRGAIQSILEQSFADFELIIVDNASTDGTSEICREFAAKDNRIRYYRNEVNIGGAPNHNRVFELSTGKFFKWASHDDLYPKEMLRRCLEVLEAAPDSVSLVYSQFELIDESGESLGIESDPIEMRDPRAHVRLIRFLMKVGYCTATYGLIRSDILRKTRLMASFPFSDRVYLAELAMLGELWEIREPLLRLRNHAGRSTKANKTVDSIRKWYDPAAAKMAMVLPLQIRADVEIVRSALRLPMAWKDRMLCFGVAMAVPCWLRLLKWSFPVRRRLGLAPSVKRRRTSALRLARQGRI